MIIFFLITAYQFVRLMVPHGHVNPLLILSNVKDGWMYSNHLNTVKMANLICKFYLSNLVICIILTSKFILKMTSILSQMASLWGHPYSIGTKTMPKCFSWAQGKKNQDHAICILLIQIKTTLTSVRYLFKRMNVQVQIILFRMHHLQLGNSKRQRMQIQQH